MRTHPSLPPLSPPLEPAGWLRLRRALFLEKTPPSLETVKNRIAAFLVSRTMLETGIPLDAPSHLLSWLARHLGLSRGHADALAAQLAVLPKPLHPLPEVPDALDLAGPLLDRFAPRLERKPLGLFVTSAPIAMQLANLLLESRTGPLRLLDHAAGTGTLPLAVLHRLLADGAPLAPLLAELRRGWCIVEHDPILAACASLQIIRAGWPHWPPGDDPWPVQCDDGLSPRPATFTHAIGNPPYLGEKQARHAIEAARRAHPDLAAVYRGKADLFFFFVWRALLSLEPGGRLALLTPASWTTADSAAPLRAQLHAGCDDLLLHNPKGRIPSAPGLEMTLLTATRRPEARSDPCDAPLFRMLPTPLETILARMAALPRTMGGDRGPFALHAGIQTGADRLTDSRHVPGTAGGFVLTPDEAESWLPDLNSQERMLLKPLVKSPALGPYILDDAPGAFLLYLDGSVPIERLPRFHARLRPHQARLSERREVRSGRMPWWRLHWPRQAAIFETPSLLIPQRAAWPRAAIAPRGAYTSVDVYHATLQPGSEMGLHGWAAWFHSLPVAAWLAFRGKRKGRLFELYHTPLRAIPLPPDLDPTVTRALEQAGRRVHDAMRRLNETSRREGPWHRRWQGLTGEETSPLLVLRASLETVDTLVGGLYGLDHDDLDTLRMALNLATR